MYGFTTNGIKLKKSGIIARLKIGEEIVQHGVLTQLVDSLKFEK